MLDLRAAGEIAARTGPKLDLSAARELREGWFFPNADPLVGSTGIIVNKRSGRTLVLGSAFPIERDLRAYDDGYQIDCGDLVITRVLDTEATVETLAKIRPTVVEPEYEHSRVWRIPREIGRNELRARLQRLPCIFEGVRLYFVVEHLQEARASGWFDFVITDEHGKQP
jgi:hypothetical protein